MCNVPTVVRATEVRIGAPSIQWPMVAAALRFCVVTTFYPPYNFGGDGIYAHRLANALARRGHRVSVIHSPSAYELLARRIVELARGGERDHDRLVAAALAQRPHGLRLVTDNG